MNDRILLIRTGGTIDAQAYSDPRSPPEFTTSLDKNKSLIMATLSDMPNGDIVDNYAWSDSQEAEMVKDSKLYSQANIDILADIIKQDKRKYFIITHGTDKIAENAELLQGVLKDTDKIVVFIGSMVPLSMENGDNGDGYGMMSYGLSDIKNQDNGVHIVARDNITKRLGFFNPQKVQKDRYSSKEELEFTVMRKEF